MPNSFSKKTLNFCASPTENLDFTNRNNVCCDSERTCVVWVIWKSFSTMPDTQRFFSKWGSFSFKATQQNTWHNLWEYAGRKVSSALLLGRLMIVTEQSTILPSSYHCLVPVFQGQTCGVKETRCQTRLTLYTVTWQWLPGSLMGLGLALSPNQICEQRRYVCYWANTFKGQTHLLHAPSSSTAYEQIPRRPWALESLRRTTSRNLKSLHQCEIHYYSWCVYLWVTLLWFSLP